MQTADSTTAAVARTSAGAPEELTLDRYRLVRRLGSGAFGVVWLARDEQLDRMVAVKRIEAGDEHIAARAQREALASARLAHPGIVALHEAGRDEHAVYLVSEMVRGRTLGELSAAGALSDRDLLRIGRALCGALEHAHSSGVIHRDVKPANIIVPERPLGEAGLAKLTDFGVALMAGDEALTRTGDVVGTLAYMAPEQADGHEVTGAADLYALALVLYEALSGVNPVRAPGAAATARRLGTRLPPLERLRRDLPAELCGALDRALLPRPEQRGTLDELAGAIGAALEQAQSVVGERSAEAPAFAAPGDWHPELPPFAAEQAQGALAGRLLAAVVAAALSGGALTALAPTLGVPPLVPALAAAACALVVLLTPRAGWGLGVAALAAWLAQGGQGGVALLLLAAALPAVVLLPRSGELWPLPAAAPLLALMSLGLAWPAFAAQARGPLRRALLGALGAWWILLAEAIARPALIAGDVPGTPAPYVWRGSADHAIGDVLVPLARDGRLLLAVAWGLAAALLPLLVRGRRVGTDALGALLWALALCAASVAVLARLGPPAPGLHGALAGTVAAALIALLAAAPRRA